MANGIKNATGGLARFILSLRYRVRVVGLDAVRGRKGVLILPNHPGYTDPPLVLSHLSALAPRPMLLAPMFESPLLFWIPRALGALKIPSLDQHSTEARKQTEESIEAIAAGLERGENFILWPAGRVQRDGREVLGSRRSVAAIAARVPDVKLLLVRTRGLRGSMFSYARTGLAPNITMCLLKGVGLVLANLLLLIPRRRIEITVKEIGRAALPGVTRETLNPFLEAWYNEPGTEEPTHVPYHFAFGARSFAFPAVSANHERAFDDIDPKTRSAIGEAIWDKLGSDTIALDDPTTSLDSLGLDSLDRMELSLQVEERFGFRGEEVPETVGDLWELAEGRGVSMTEITAPPTWFRDGERQGPARLAGNTILEALVLRAVEHSRDVVVADDLSGVLTYERFLVAIQAFARQLDRRIAAQNVGVLLPASVATDLVIFAIHLAGKTPVMLNWTTGPSNLAHAAQTMRLTHVVSSQRFIDRMGIVVEGTEYLFLEDVRNSISKLELAWLLVRTRLAPRGLLRRLPAASADDLAVVLFTSGSEKAPKAVPLTHENILSNLGSVLDGYDIYRTDVMLGFLPPFHSFGFTLTVMLPILGGCRVVHHPDPTDAGALGRKVHTYLATMLCATPTFLGYILKRSTREELASLRLAVVGGEKCPDVQFEEFTRMIPEAHLLEGYGVTECSPLVCCTRFGMSDRGTMGQPLPGVDLLLVDPDTRELVPAGEVGMLIVAGRNVFPGYLDYDGPSPFHEHDGRRWYVTGDLAVLDADGRYHFRGRLKRFLKIGGEMVSLPAIEAPLTQRFPPSDDGPRVAVEGVDEPARRIVLFTVEPIALRDGNAILVEAGLRGIMRLDEVQQVDAIPLLGTGKIDYKVLRKSCLESTPI